MKQSLATAPIAISFKKILRLMRWTLLISLGAVAFHQPDYLMAASGPRPQVTIAPVPDPGVPSGTDPFTPDFGGSSGDQHAQFAEWTRQGIPGDTIAATGQFSSFSGLDEGRDMIFIAHGQNSSGSAALPCKIQRLNGRFVGLTLDPALPDGMFLIWPRNSIGVGYPVAVNQTEAWWVGPSTATRGDAVAVYGRNLSQRSGTNTACSAVYIKPAASSGQWANIVSVNPYKVKFTVPTNLVNGTYEVWIHNKMGGRYGWSGPLSLTIDNGYPWSGPTYNVINYGANGADAIDDTAAIKNAMNAAALVADSTVYLPAGTYYVSSNIKVPANVRWRGDGAASTLISAWINNNFKMFSIGTSHVEFQDLKMSLGLTGTTMCINGGFNGIRLTNCEFQTDKNSKQNAIYLADGSGAGCVIENCVFKGGWPISTQNAKQFIIRDSAFYGAFDCDLIDIFGNKAREVSIINCTGQDLDNTNIDGWCGGRFVKNMGSRGSMYIGDCITTELGVRPGFSNQNQGEHILWEQNFGTLLSAVSGATSTTVSMTGGAAAADQMAVVINGKGVGQSRNITSVSGSTATISPAWNIIPDTSSTIAVCKTMDKAVVYNNHLGGKAAVTGTANNGSSGVNSAGGILNLVIDHNTINSTRYGIRTVAKAQMDSSPTNAIPSYFNVVQNNLITNCRWALLHGFAAGNDPAFTAGVYSLGHVFRGNSIQSPIVDSMEINTAAWAQSQSVKPVEMLIYDYNTVSFSPAGMNATLGTPAGVGDFLMIENSMSGTPNLSLAAGQLPGLFNNTWNGINFGGALPGGILEVPLRRISVNGSANGPVVNGTFEIQNHGTSALSWTLASGSSWLTVLSATGNIPDQASVSTVTFSCNPGGLSPGLNAGVLTVTSGTQAKKITILFNVQ